MVNSLQEALAADGREQTVQGTTNPARAFSAAGREWHPSRWSLTSPMACMKAYTVVGPTKLQPRFFRSLDMAIDAGDVDRVRATSRVSRSGRSAAAGS